MAKASTIAAQAPLRDRLLLVGRLFPAGATGGGQDRQEAKDASYECTHGRLPHDRTTACGCWPQEITKTNPTQEVTNGSHRDRLDRFASQARGSGADDRPADRRPVSA